MLICVLSLLFSSSALAAGEPVWAGPWRGISELVAVLETVPEGKRILDQAQAKNGGFLTQIHRGSASYTESTFVRTYSLLDGKERIELRHELTLSKELNLANAVVDLAHELVHYTDKGMLDPYRPGFALKEFVKNGIEGPGGELAALKEECLVAWSLERKYRNYPKHLLCSGYHEGVLGFDSAKAKRDYYALGGWYHRADAELKRVIPELSASRVQFNSSYAAKPYPVALAEEFRETKRAACANNRRKYRLIAAQATGRGPASSSLESERSKLQQYDRNFCRGELGPVTE